LGVEGSRWTAWLMGEKRAKRGKHRTEVTEGEIDVGREGLSVEGVADGRETREEGKASHRGHRGGN
jgi:hypothetical protein